MYVSLLPRFLQLRYGGPLYRPSHIGLTLQTLQMFILNLKQHNTVDYFNMLIDERSLQNKSFFHINIYLI